MRFRCIFFRDQQTITLLNRSSRENIQYEMLKCQVAIILLDSKIIFCNGIQSMRLLQRLARRLPVGRCISMGMLRENERLLFGGFCASSLHCRECNMRPIMKALRGTLPLLSGLYRAHSITNEARADVPTGLSVTPGCVVWKMPSIAFSAVHFLAT